MHCLFNTILATAQQHSKQDHAALWNTFQAREFTADSFKDYRKLGCSRA